MTTRQMLIGAKKAAASAMLLDTDTKNAAIEAMARAIEDNIKTILCANAQDMEKAKGKLSASMLDRLKLDEKRIYSVTAGMRKVMELPDPVGRTLSSEKRPNGLLIEKITVPMGVVAIIYESRPNVTADAAVLCFKSSNVCVLRCGRDSFLSAKAIVDAMREGLEAVGLKRELINLVPDPSRESAAELMKAEGLVDLLIPRGGAGLIKSCVENATVPCIRTGTGICHIYVDKSADIGMALDIIDNAKCQRPSVCNAAEVLLVHRDILKELMPLVKKRICSDREAKGLCPVKLLGDDEVRRVISCEAAGEGDFDTEFLDYILAVKAVSGVAEAVEHIAEHSTGHSEAILSRDEAAINAFVGGIDSAAVYVNASTRFTDGGEFGLGCEMGIATQKLHARGPMGLCELVSYKYVIKGNGQIRG
ncbi:MAG: glutamate-5-semialdehyde dehydrogenase [Ruminococcaceae bacterium]|nr:glutamate-5-semialdehyde dehydrogenase [Oscillospiraceae bacterium]